MERSDLGAWGEGVRTLVRQYPLTRSLRSRPLPMGEVNCPLHFPAQAHASISTRPLSASPLAPKAERAGSRSDLKYVT